jgi:16S rRNA (guanine966-N2)-methyltransferase
MRIISGKFRGRRLAAVRGDIRPTGDRLRETLFDVIGPAVAGTFWLDAFAGTGAIGLEALSRGAASVIFNDTSRDAVRLIEKNLELCGVQDGFRIEQKDVFSLLRSLKPPLPDVIYFDPPYDFGRYDKLLRKALDFGAVGPETMIIMETFKKALVHEPAELGMAKEVRSGDSCLKFYRRKAP